MKFLKRWFGKTERTTTPQYEHHNTGYTVSNGQSYHNLLKYVLYLNQNTGKPWAQPTGPEHYQWWENALFEAVEGPTVHLSKGFRALEYIHRINFEDHGKSVPEELKVKAHARMQLGFG